MHPDIQKLRNRFERGEPTLGVVFGTSISFGSQIDPASDPSIVYHKQWRDDLQSRFPNLELTLDNQGVPGNKVIDALARIEESAIKKNPEFIIVEFGINDCWDGPEKVEDFDQGLRRILSRLREETDSVLIVMTVNMLNHNVLPGALQLAWFAEKTADVQTLGWTEAYMNRVRELAPEFDLPLADGYAEWEAARERGTDTDLLLSNMANHPNKKGHRLLADALSKLFGL
ncbi:MAG: hypothetical protein KC917_15305 [Candidatus Omnitrophica bacterium]|nr:hypothetical protein [Candidatus Omnitrophota bacterium]